MSSGAIVTTVVFLAAAGGAVRFHLRQRSRERVRRRRLTHSGAYRVGGHDERARIREGGRGDGPV